MLRQNSDYCSISCGVKTGHYHVSKGSNCQDAAIIYANKDVCIGIGCDGCGEGLHSEMGALAVSNFALSETCQLCKYGYHISEIMERLFSSIIKFIHMNILTWDPSRTLHDIANLIKDYWLTTIMGIIATKDECIVFWAGDGTYAYANSHDPHIPSIHDIVYIDQNNCPSYIAYKALPAPQTVGVKSENIPNKFDYISLPFASKVMIASDGFSQHNIDKISVRQEKEPDLTFDLNGQQWNKKGQFGLKKWMNSRSDRGYFDDDCFIITAEYF